MTAKTTKPDLILVDGSSYLYRAFHALPPLSTRKGQPTGAVKGVISMLRSLIKDYPQARIVIIFDAKGKTFRADLYPQYKANRPAMPDDLRLQISPIHNIINAMGLPLIIKSGVEADDVIGTLAKQASEQGMTTLISTGDKDMAQLVSEQVMLVNTMTGQMLDIEGVKDKFGIAPQLIADYLALTGDQVDNIPGVPGVGPKTAVKWLLEFGSLDKLMANAAKIGGKAGDRLTASLDYLPLSHTLTTIKCDVELDQPVTELSHKSADNSALVTLFTELEFNSWRQEFADQTTSTTTSCQSTIAKHYEVILAEEDFSRWLSALKCSGQFAFDVETTHVDYMQAQLVGVSFAIEPHHAAYVPVAHDYVGVTQQLTGDYVLSQLKPLLEDPTLLKIGQNIKYDRNLLAGYDISMQGIEDTMLQSYVLNSTASRHNINDLALYYLDYKTIHFEDIAGKGVKQLAFNQIELAQAGPYAAEDADITLCLYQTLNPKLTAIKKLHDVYEHIEKPLIPIIADMERHGVLVDTDLLNQQSSEIKQSLLTLEQQVFELAGEEFNLNSPRQLQAIFYEKLKLPILKKTPKGQPSTAEPILQALALNYPLPKLILEHRTLSKLKQTYTDRLPLQINPDTGRIHTSYHQAVTATGRLSSSDPNLQNIPIRNHQGRRIRQAFIAPTGYQLVAADYSQIELRIMAHLSQDKGLLAAFAAGDDIHQATAAELFSVPAQAVTHEQRRSAKAINFGLMYGMSAFGLARQLGIGQKQAKAYIEQYFSRYPAVQEYMDSIRKQAAQQGYIETIFGRRLYLPDINTRNAMQRQAAERTAINAPMQGSAADIIKKAMINVATWLASTHLDARMTMQVHDELVFEVNVNDMDRFTSGITEQMSLAANLDVPLLVTVGYGDNWDKAH